MRMRLVLISIAVLTSVELNAAPWLPPAAQIAARTNGVAPLAVFFDASGATSDVTAIPFHELDFQWDFDDLTAGTWSTDGRGRNAARGPVTAHVFETPGHHNVTLTVRDINGGVAHRTIAIHVTDPDTVFSGTNTVCISASGDFTGAPAGALQITSTSIGTAQAYISPGTRILFRRGDTWQASSGLRINAQGPGLIGSFGSGALPLITATGNFTLFALSDRVPNCDDWRCMDIQFDGNNMSGASGVGTSGTATRMLFLRLRLHDVHAGMVIPVSILNYQNSHGYPGHTLYDQITIADCRIERLIGGSGGNGGYIAAHRLAILGCQMHDSTGAEHVLRTPWIQRGVIAHNAMSMQSPGKHLIKMHAPGFYGSGLGYTQYTERVVVSDNRFVGNGAWSVTPGPQNSAGDERVRNLIVERNHFVHSNNVQVSLVIWARDVTVRNNIFDVTAGAAATAIAVTRRGIEPASRDVRIYNNTAFTRNAGGVRLVSVADVVTNTTVINNLVAAPPGGSPSVSSGTGAGFIESHNMATLSPGFASTNPIAPTDVLLLATSAAVNAGTNAPVFEDYFLTPRPGLGTNDLGACEYIPEPCISGAVVPGLMLCLRALRHE
jgi:PKD repeat protein